jgi:hypothetical protein
MNTRRISLTVGAAAGGMLAAAFLSTATAFADDNGTSDGADLFGFTLPSDMDWTGEAGWPPFLQEASAHTTLSFDSDDAASGAFGDVSFGDDGITQDVGADVTNYSTFTGVDSQTIALTDPILDGDDHTVLGDGSVFNVTNAGFLGLGNVYADLDGVGDSGANEVHDWLVTPLGTIDLSGLFGDVDASDNLGDVSGSITDIDPSDGLNLDDGLFGGLGGLFSGLFSGVEGLFSDTGDGAGDLFGGLGDLLTP